MRKILASLLAWLLLFCGAAQAALCVRMDDGAALIDRDGREIVPVGTYEDIVALGEDRFAARLNGSYALLDGDGAPLTEFVYEEVLNASDLFLARRDGLWGILNADGSARGAFAYSAILPSETGGAWALKGERNDFESDLLYLISASGLEWETSLRVLDVGSGSEGLLSVQIPGSGLYGYCDAAGNLAIPARYGYAGDFADGRAIVVAGGKYGVIDAAGEYVLAPAYDFLELSPAGCILASVELEGAIVFDADGAEIARYEGSDVSVAAVGDGYCVADPDGLRLYDSSGKLLLEASAGASISEGVGGQMIVSDGPWGEECVRLIGSDAAYQNLYPLGTAGEEALYACMTVNVGRYVNDRLNEIQLSTDMDSARYGVVNGAGEVLLESRYRALYCLGDDRLLARTDEAWQVIDARGAVYWQLDAPMQTEAPSF